MKKLKLDQITIDAGTQTRITMNEETIADYAEVMTESPKKLPPVVVFVSGTEYLLADGFHRFMAAQRNGWREINTEVRKGSRLDAIKYSLGANVGHGLRRNNADKRRCVEIALKEFGKLSSRAIASMCGVGDQLVGAIKSEDQVRESRTSTVTGKDGKSYPAIKPAREAEAVEDKALEGDDKPKRKESVKMGPPCCGMMIAGQAIARLEEITPDDTERREAFNHVKKWIHDNEN